MQDGIEPIGGAPPREAEPGAHETPALLELQSKWARSQRVAALAALAARLAHELGTPLHSISGHLDLMLTDPSLSGEHRRRTEIVAGEVGRLSVMIRRYLTRLRPPDPQPRDTDLRALVERVTEALQPLVLQRGVEIEFDFGAGTERPFACDPEQIEQVVVNLVQNAVDAMPDGGVLVIRTSASKSGRTLSVCDAGVGIAREHRDHIFEPFFSTKETSRGSGLGLAICREIARAHGGDILLDSKRQVGTIVTLTLESLASDEA